MSREQYINSDLTEIVAILDASASMAGLIKSVTEGINAFVNEQKEQPGSCFITIYTFDSVPSWSFNSIEHDRQDLLRLKKIRSRVSVKDFIPVSSEDYQAGGNTPLNDAVMTVIQRTGEDFSARPFSERPGNVILFVSTDGEENDSRRYPGFGNTVVRDTINHQESKYNWHFIFTGSDPRTYEQGSVLGVGVSNVLNYVASDIGTKALYSGVSKKISALRSNEVTCCAFTAEEKAEIENLEDGSDPLRSVTLSSVTSTPSTDGDSD